MGEPSAVGSSDAPRGGLIIKTTSRSVSRASPISPAGSATVISLHHQQQQQQWSSSDGDSCSPDSSRSSAASDWMKPDLDWTNKYLNTDRSPSRALSPRPTATAAAAAADALMSPTNARASNGYEAPLVARTMRRTEQDLQVRGGHSRQLTPSRSTSLALAARSNSLQHLNGGGIDYSYSSSSSSALRHSPTSSCSYAIHYQQQPSSSYDARHTTRPRARSTIGGGVFSATVSPSGESANNYALNGSIDDTIDYYSSMQLNQRPAMSETRRKLRKLICRSKGDSRYYDF